MKALLYTFVGFLYAAGICEISFYVFLFTNISLGFAISFLLTIILGFVAICLGVVNLVEGFSRKSKPEDDAYKTVMVVKISLIPYFILKLVGFIFFFVDTYAYLMLVPFIVIPIMHVLNYGAMLCVSSYNIGALTFRIKNKQNTFKEMAFFIVSQFFYILDVVGAILIFVRERNEKKS